jgi:preprotein translocase subunit SecG
MSFVFFTDPLKIATIVFSVFFLICVLAALYFQERNKAPLSLSRLSRPSRLQKND